MFDNQNKNFNSIKTQVDSVDVNTLPIRTMEKDLKNINDPNFNAGDFATREDTPAKKESFESSLSEKQKTSPFLNPAQPKKESPIINASASLPKSIAPSEKIPSVREKEVELDVKKVAMFAGAIFIVLAGIATGYYFMVGRSAKNEITTIPEVSSANPVSSETNTPTNIVNPSSDNTSENNAVVAAEEQKSINTDKPNFLIVDTQVKDSSSIQEIIRKKIEDVKAAKIYAPTEFILTDKTFAPLAFQDFSQKIGLSLPANIIGNFKTTFSLFINNTEKNQTDIALLIDVKEDQSAKSALSALLSKEEPQLVKELDFLFLGKPHKTKGVPFFTNNYKNTEIRYHNIQPGGLVAIDYAILKTKLLLTP
jgi:hypothetical protein